MADDKLGIFEEMEDVADDTAEPGPDAGADAAPEAEPEAVKAAEPTGEDPAAPPAATEEGTKASIPVTALMDEREKRQRAERELEEMRRWRMDQERKAQEAQMQQKRPDFWENPEAAVQQHLTQVKLQQSRFLAEREYGAELVAEAYGYFDKHPQESAQLINHPSPFHAAVEHYKRQKFLAEVQDPDKWREQERERIRQEVLAEQQQARPSKPPAPPPSVARAPSAGGTPPVTVEAPERLQGLFNG